MTGHKNRRYILAYIISLRMCICIYVWQDIILGGVAEVGVSGVTATHYSALTYICICVYICIHIYMYIYIYMTGHNMYTRSHIFVYIYIHIYIYIYIWQFILIGGVEEVGVLAVTATHYSALTYVCIYVYIYEYIYTYVYMTIHNNMRCRRSWCVGSHSYASQRAQIYLYMCIYNWQDTIIGGVEEVGVSGVTATHYSALEHLHTVIHIVKVSLWYIYLC